MLLYGNCPFFESPAVGRFLAAHSDARDTVFILGSEPQILYYAGRKSATRYIFVSPLTGPFPDARDRQHAALREVAHNDPRFIVTVFSPTSFVKTAASPMDIFAAVAEILNQSYRVAAV